MADFDLSVTICSWNTQGELRACLESLAAVRDEASFEVVVVDNNSEDGSPDMVEREFPWVRLEKMSRNLGFTGGQNHAMRVRKGANALLLNSDTIVHPGAFRELMTYMRAHPEAGIIGPKLLNSDGTLQYSCRRFPNPVAALFRNTIFGRLFPKNRFAREYLMQDLDHGQASKVDWVSGAALLATERLIDTIGLLDEEYFMFCEDTDWCYRAWQAKFEVHYVPMSVITHACGKSTDKAPNRMIDRHHRSMLLFYRKHMASKLPIVVRPFAIGAAWAAIGMRSALYIVNNKVDIVRRWLRR